MSIIFLNLFKCNPRNRPYYQTIYESALGLSVLLSTIRGYGKGFFELL